MSQSYPGRSSTAGAMGAGREESGNKVIYTRGEILVVLVLALLWLALCFWRPALANFLGACVRISTINALQRSHTRVGFNIDRHPDPARL